MTTIKEIIAAGEKLNKALKSAGLKVNPFVRPPVAKELFGIELTEDRKTIRLWLGKAKVTGIHIDKKRHQAVFTVSEGRREVTRKVKGVWGPTLRRSESLWNDSKPSYFSPEDFRFVNHFPISMPGNPLYTVKNKERDEKTGQWSADVTATAEEETVTHFFVGQDEHAYFISALPSKPNSVTHAHAILRPKGVPKNAPRQGEWFFVPVDAKTRAKLNKGFLSNWTDLGQVGEYNGGVPLNGSNHVAAISNGDGFDGYDNSDHYPLYVFGPIVDTSGRHETLFLDTWHRVYINTELEVEGSDEGRWD